MMQIFNALTIQLTAGVGVKCAKGKAVAFFVWYSACDVPFTMATMSVSVEWNSIGPAEVMVEWSLMDGTKKLVGT